jgi:hypothetical protein
MATVYRAHHKLVDRPFAIKVLNVQLAQDRPRASASAVEAKHSQRIARTSSRSSTRATPMTALLPGHGAAEARRSPT